MLPKRIVESVKYRLRAAALQRQYMPARKAILSAYGLRPAKVAALSSCSVDTIQISGESPFCVISPELYGKKAKNIRGIYPPLKMYHLDGVVASTYSSAFVKDQSVILPDDLIGAREGIRTHTGGLIEFTPSSAFIQNKIDQEIPSAIHIGGAGAFNWYHFIIECLPKAYLAQRLPSKFDSIPLLVPEECMNIASFSEAIRIFSGGRKLIGLGRKQSALIRNLYVFDEVSRGPFNMVSGEWPQVGDYSQHDTELECFIKEFRARILVQKNQIQPRKKIFLARPAKRRTYNQDELVNIARKYDVDPLYLEDFSLKEQAELFSSASHVIGPSGAAWVGMIFARHPIRGLSWLPAEYAEFSSYSSLAKLLRHRLDFILTRTMHPLKSTGEAYSASYSVHPHEFEYAVQQMMR